MTVGYAVVDDGRALEFADEVQTLLLALGFVTTAFGRTSAVAGRGSPCVRLLNRASNTRWLDEIGFISGRKCRAGRCAARLSRRPVTTTSR